VLLDGVGLDVLPRLGSARSLARTAFAEGIGTAGLVCAVIGSGIAAQRLSPSDVGLQLLENSIATSLALIALILALGGVSGAHLNPVVTGVEWARRRLPTGQATAYVAAQVAGGVLGAAVANAMFEHPAFEAATRERGGVPVWLGEVVATSGLVVTVRGIAASAPRAIPLAVAAYIGAAYWFTSSTSFANPAVTVARSLSDSFAGIAPVSVPVFVGAQIVGAAIGALLAAILFDAPRDDRSRGGESPS
jgi:arsenate reductase